MMSVQTISNSTADGRSVMQDNPFQNVYPTLVECFAIILFGYLAGRGKLVSPTQAKGLEIYAVSAALPASILKSMIELDFGTVNLGLWLSLALSKLILFLVVAALSILLTRPVNFGRAGICGIFVTQSNDFALGLPLFSAIYRDSPENFCQYIYLLIPVSFGLLNPIGFLLLEYEKSRNNDGQAIPKWKIAWTVLKKVITNPLVYTVILGLIVNFISHHHIPEVIKRCLEVLANSYGAIALFCLGLSMVGSMKQFSGFRLILSVVLIIAKSIVLPFICKEMSYFVTKYTSNLNSTQLTSISTFSFLYGTLPTAPTVAIYAAKYSVATDMVAASMVLGTIMSAPIMFISSKMILIQMLTQIKEFHKMIATAVYDVSILSVACCIWVFAVFLIGKQILHLPQRWTACLLLSQFFVSLCPLLGNSPSISNAANTFINWLFIFSYMSVVLWSALLGVTLAYIRWKGEAAYKKYMKICTPFIGWGFSAVLALPLVFTLHDQPVMNINTNRFIGSLAKPALNIPLVICLILSLGVTLVSLMFLHRRDRYCRCEHRRLSVDAGASSTEEDGKSAREPCCACTSSKSKYTVFSSDIYNPVCHKNCANPTVGEESLDGQGSLNGEVNDIEDLSFLLIDAGDHSELISSTKVDNLADFEDNLITLKQFDDGGRHQISRHIILLILLSMTNLLSIFLCFWRLFKSMMDGIYLEIEFLVSVLTFGQGFLSFAVFGFNKEIFISPAMRRFFRFHVGCFNRRIRLPSMESLDMDDQRICEQFRSHHLVRCKQELVRNLRFHLKSYDNVFRGDDFVSWLLNYGLAGDRSEAVRYGNSLLYGRVLKHCVEEHHFQDQPYFYTFIEDEITASV